MVPGRTMRRLRTLVDTPRNRIRDRRGMTVVEVMISLVVLSVATVGLMQMLSASSYNSIDRRSYEMAQHIMANEVERLRVTGPWPMSADATPSITLQLDEHGKRLTSGTGKYQLYLARETQCNGGTWMRDNFEPIPPGGCDRVRATARFTAQLTYPFKTETRTITQQWTVGPGEPQSGSWNPALTQ